MKNLKKHIALIVIVTQFFWSISGYANPTGGVVTSGAATITTAGNTLTVNQSTNQLITNWQSFSIAANETTNFIQPSSSSVALNRVVGSSPSEIYGALNANGKVFLINQNGILFAPGSHVNVGGLVASTLDIRDANFLSGQYTDHSTGQVVNGYYFRGHGGFGSVINHGTININAPGGYAALLGSNVQNSGAIITKAGPVVLASGRSIAVNLDSSGTISAVLVKRALHSNLSGSANAILNSGSINANGGNVIITAKSLQGLFTNLINNTGIIEASSVSSEGGVVTLSANGGQVTNSGTIQAQKSITVTADGDVNLEGGGLTVNSTTGGNISLNGDNVDIGSAVNANTGDVTVNAQSSITNNSGNGLITANNLSLTANNDIGTSTNPVNTNANDISAVSQDVGNIYLKQATAVSLSHIFAANGLIDVIANGQINAEDVTTGGGVGNSISLKTIFGDIDVGNVSAAGGLGDVTLDSAGNIYDINANSMITANNLNLNAGINGSSVGLQLLLGSNVNTYVVGGHQVLAINNQPGAASYDVYFRSGFSGPWTKVASNVSASNGSTTIWTDPSPAIIGGFASYYVQVATAQTSNIGTSTNRINTNVNAISAVSQDVGNIYLKQSTAVTLSHIFAANGLIDVIANGQINAEDVVSAGGSGNDGISLKTTFGDIDVGNISTAGYDNVTLDSAGNIYDINANSMITANYLYLSSGINGSAVGNMLLMGTNVNTYVVGGHQVLAINNQPGAASYDVYFRSGFSGPWQKVASNVSASNGSTTIWTDPSPAIIGGFASYYVQVATAQTSNIGTSTNRINTNVNNIYGNSKNIGNIYLYQAKDISLGLNAANGLIDVISAWSMSAENVTTGGGLGDSITLTAASGDIAAGSINSSGDVFLNAVNGPIIDVGGLSNVTSVGDMHLSAGNVIGSWSPSYRPLNVNVGKDLYLTIASRADLATGSVGPMGVSGTLSGTVGGVYHFVPGTHDPYNSANSVFNGNPPGYIFLNKIEIWPNLTLPPTVINNTDLAAAQVANAIQQNQTVYYEKQNRHLIRQVEVAEPLGIYMYHSLVDSDNSAVDHIKLEPEAYDYIDQNINLINPLGPALQAEGQKPT